MVAARGGAAAEAVTLIYVSVVCGLLGSGLLTICLQEWVKADGTCAGGSMIYRACWRLGLCTATAASGYSTVAVCCFAMF